MSPIEKFNSLNMINSSVMSFPIMVIESTINGYKLELDNESVFCGKISEEITITISKKTIFTLVLIFNTKRYCFLVQFFDLLYNIGHKII